MASDRNTDLYDDLEKMRQYISAIETHHRSGADKELGEAIGQLHREVSHLFTQRVYDEVSDRRGIPRIVLQRK